MGLVKCPYYKSRRLNAIFCIDKLSKSAVFSSKDAAEMWKKTYCDTMRYTECKVYLKRGSNND
jgi:hypothetical protein